MKIEIKGDKVTSEEVENAIVEKSFVKLGKKMVVCHLTLADGHEVIGQAGVVNPNNFKQEIGESIAYDNAKDQVWRHMGSILQDRLESIGKDYKERLKIENEELSIKYTKLLDALDNSRVPEDARAILIQQAEAMKNYLNILGKRLSL